MNCEEYKTIFFVKQKTHCCHVCVFCEMQMLFVLVNGREKSNALVLDYFKLRSRDLPRIAIYDGDSDREWLMPKGEISAERVQNFCDSYLRGDLQVRLP